MPLFRDVTYSILEINKIISDLKRQARARDLENAKMSSLASEPMEGRYALEHIRAIRTIKHNNYSDSIITSELWKKKLSFITLDDGHKKSITRQLSRHFGFRRKALSINFEEFEYAMEMQAQCDWDCYSNIFNMPVNIPFNSLIPEIRDVFLVPLAIEMKFGKDDRKYFTMAYVNEAGYSREGNAVLTHIKVKYENGFIFIVYEKRYNGVNKYKFCDENGRYYHEHNQQIHKMYEDYKTFFIPAFPILGVKPSITMVVHGREQTEAEVVRAIQKESANDDIYNLMLNIKEYFLSRFIYRIINSYHVSHPRLPSAQAVKIERDIREAEQKRVLEEKMARYRVELERRREINRQAKEIERQAKDKAKEEARLKKEEIKRAKEVEKALKELAKLEKEEEKNRKNPILDLDIE